MNRTGDASLPSENVTMTQRQSPAQHQLHNGLAARKDCKFKFVCNWENMTELSTSSFSAILYKSLHNKITLFKSFIRTKRSYLLCSSLTNLSASGKHRLGGCISNTTSSSSAAVFMQESGPRGLNTTLHYPRTKRVRRAINYHSQKAQMLFSCRLGFQFCSHHQY